MENPDSRRPIETRNANWAQNTASWLASNHITPNVISIWSIVFSAISLVAFWFDYNCIDCCGPNRCTGMHVMLMILAIVGIQGRLIMNLLDGMVAVEHNKKSIVGGLFNEVPDRISDTLTLFGVGLLAKHMPYGMDLAYLAIFLSVMTAYIRTLGASLGCGHFFSGPMAKQHRMALVCAGCLVGIFYTGIFYYLLILMNIGLVATCVNRLSKIVRQLKHNANG